MKRWAVLTVLIYALALLALTAPVLMLAFSAWGNNPIKLEDELGIFKTWGYWLWLAVLVAGQFLLLLVPIDISEKRLPARRKLKIPVIVTAFFLANLCFAGIFSILCAAFTDHAFEHYDLSEILFPSHASPFSTSGWGEFSTMILTVLVFWLIWSIIFRRATKSDKPDALIKRAVRWLLRGSVLELLVAVPSHVIVRRRDDCCAPIGTFWGIATGISVMLLCFGPGVYFLFVEKFQRLKPKPLDAETQS